MLLFGALGFHLANNQFEQILHHDRILGHGNFITNGEIFFVTAGFQGNIFTAEESIGMNGGSRTIRQLNFVINS